jgi:hypothetical protein
LRTVQGIAFYALENLALLRLCLTILAVAALSACLVHYRDVQGQSSGSTDVTQIAWVRTVDGWEPSTVLMPRPRQQGPPTVHPGLIAGLQLGVSVFALLALPPGQLNGRKP